MRFSYVVGAIAVVTIGGCFISLKDYPVDAGGGGGGDSSGGAGGAGGSAGAGGAGTGGAGELGARCDPSTPCESDLECWSEDQLGFGPAGGVCTKTCEENEDCGGNGVCYKNSLFSTCIEQCTVGDQNSKKCHERRDVGCVRVIQSPAIDGCLPFCSDDADCEATGRVCSRKSGLCTDSALTGAPAGDACFDSDECRGGCEGVCAEGCVIGAPSTCDQSNTTDPGAEAHCVGSVEFETGAREEVGDLSYCVRPCTCGTVCPGGGESFVCADALDGEPHCVIKGGGDLTPCGLGEG